MWSTLSKKHPIIGRSLDWWIQKSIKLSLDKEWDLRREIVGNNPLDVKSFTGADVLENCDEES